MNKKNRFATFFDRFSAKITRMTGRPATFIIALLIVVVWALSGPLFGYSDTWQLVINTGTTIITFLMVFVIQQSQNKDTAALHLKMNELIAASENASNRLVCVEELTEEELAVLKKFYLRLNELSRKDNDLFSSHSIDEADENHEEKRRQNYAKRPISEA
ncbi:low affinity iron permease family protein [Chitinophagaceae bacterium MMS25-I14]